MIGVHDFVLVMLETEGLGRPLHAMRLAAARPHLLDAQLSFARCRQYRVAARFAFTVFARRGEPTHGSPPWERLTPGVRDTELPPARCRARAQRAARS